MVTYDEEEDSWFENEDPLASKPSKSLLVASSICLIESMFLDKKSSLSSSSSPAARTLSFWSTISIDTFLLSFLTS